MTPTAEQFSELIRLLFNIEDYDPETGGHWIATEHGEISHETRKWFEGKLPEVWEGYVSHFMITYTYADDFIEDIEATIFTRMLNVTLDYCNLWEHLAGCKEKWGWVECEHYAVNCGGSRLCKSGFEYPECENGKIKNPALEFMEVSE